MVAILSFHLRLPGCTSLKEKRGRLKPLLHRLQRSFNLSVAEMDRQDAWQEAVIACAMLGNDSAHLGSAMAKVSAWVEANWTDGDIVDTKLEMI
jgi:uncharacterized protein YlxP (DUF503 family)